MPKKLKLSPRDLLIKIALENMELPYFTTLERVAPERFNVILEAMSALVNQESDKGKIVSVPLRSVKDADGWASLCFELLFDKFKEDNPSMDEDEVSDKFYSEVVSKKFQWGEFADIDVEVDSNLNVVGGRIIPFKE